jgi:tetratricopeptide (TPR) repeat protein
VLVAQLLAQGVARAASYEKAGRPYEAYVRYRVLAGGFEGMCDTTAAGNALARLDASDEVKKAMAAKEAERARRREQREKFRKRVLALQKEMGDPAKRGKAIADLMKEARGGEDAEVARRILEYFMMIYMQEASYAVREQKYDDAVKYMETVCEIVPSNGRVLYNLGCAYALAGDAEKALDALRRAVTHGWKNADHMEKDPDLKTLRDNPAFREIVDGLKGEG